MRHGVCDEAGSGIGVAIAALNASYRNMRRRRQSQCVGAVMARRAIRVSRLMKVGCAGPTREAGSRFRVASDAVAAGSCHVICVRCSAGRAAGALCGVRAVVARVAAGGAHRGMIHRVDSKVCRCIDVAITALNRPHRNMRGEVCPVAVLAL